MIFESICAANFLQARRPLCSLTNSIKSVKAKEKDNNFVLHFHQHSTQIQQDIRECSETYLKAGQSHQTVAIAVVLALSIQHSRTVVFDDLMQLQSLCLLLLIVPSAQSHNTSQHLSPYQPHYMEKLQHVYHQKVATHLFKNTAF